MRARSLLAALTAAVTLGSVGMGMAYADGIDYTTDGISSLAGNLSVKACAGQTTSFDVLVAARRNGASSDNIFANGSTVNVALVSVGSPLTAKLDKTSIQVPSTWASAANNTLSTDIVKVTFNLPPQTGSGSGAAKLSYSGVNASGGTVASTNGLTVSWTVGQCDTTPPTLHLPGAITVEATSAAGATVSYTATADDAAPAHPAVTCLPASGTIFPLGDTKVSCSATDAAGNTSTGSFTVTVQDTTPPVISNLPNDLALEATGATTAVTWAQPTATDAVSGSRDVSCAPASGSSFPVGSTKVTCTASDAAGNSATASFTVTISDTTKPVLSLPTGITAEATGPDGAAVSYNASAADLVDGAITPTCTPASGSTFALGTSTVKCSATDQAGNTATGSFQVIVRDTTAPTVTVPKNMTVEATGPDGAAADFSVSASDIVSGSLGATCDTASGSTFPLGTTTVTCTATDGAGNVGSASFVITVVDTTPPTITVPDNQVLEATGPNGATATFTAKAVDLVDGTFDATCSPASGSVFPLGSTQVNCTATDKAGNHADTKSFAVTVQDTTPPDLTLPGNFAVEATGPDGAAVSYVASATDLVDGAVTPSCDVASGTVLALGAHTITCTATDAHTNAATASFTVTVQDTTPPALTVPSDFNVEATGPDGAVVTYSVSATDLVDGAVTPSCDVASGTVLALGAHTITCTATDAHTNTAKDSFVATVRDTTPPTVTVPGDMLVEATGPNGATVSFSASAKDIVDGVMTPTCSPASGSIFPLGTSTVTCSATDAATNTGTKSFSVKVQDTTGPAITWIGGPQDGASYPYGSVPAAPTCVATDLVSGTVPCTVTGYGASTGPHTLTASATDGAGNTTKETRTYSVAAWLLKGFFQPVDMNNVVNTVKAGSTVPLKFQIFSGATQLTNTSAVKSFTTTPVSCSTLAGAATDPVDVTTTGGTSLRYDSTGGQFIQNWQTPKTVGSCYRATMTAQDGSSISAIFQLK